MSGREIPVAYFSVNCALDKPQMLNNVRVVLSHTTHPGNIGAAARAMKTMGLSHLYLINPRHFPDPQATAMAAGADDILESATVCTSIDEALQGVVHTVALTARRRDISLEVKTPRQAVSELLQHVSAHAQPVALLFGTEMSGLSNEELGKARILAHIPCNPEFSSLNLAAAVQVVAYELHVAAHEFLPDDPDDISGVQPASHEQQEGLYEHMEKTLNEIGFFTCMPGHGWSGRKSTCCAVF